MLPLILTSDANILVIGNGPATQNRLALLNEAGVHYQHITHPTTKRVQEATHATGQQAQSAGNQIIFIADFDEPTSAELYHHYKSQGALINVEDKRDYCDFHVPARVRRGDLLLTISTGGGSPRLARRLRIMLENLFPPIWAERLNVIETKRNEWKKSGASFTQVAEQTDALMDEQGWLQADCACMRASDKASLQGGE